MVDVVIIDIVDPVELGMSHGNDCRRHMHQNAQVVHILACRAGMQAHVVGTKQTMLELLMKSPEYRCMGESPRASQALYPVKA